MRIATVLLLAAGGGVLACVTCGGEPAGEPNAEPAAISSPRTQIRSSGSPARNDASTAPRRVRSPRPRAAYVEPPPALPAPSPAPETESPWFVRVQNADGSWGLDRGWKGDPKCTGLMLLTLLGAGSTHQSGEWKDNVKSGLKYLRAIQRPDGGFAPRLRDHAIAALAMVEAYGATQSVLLKEVTQRGVARAEALADAGPLDVETAAWLVLLWRSAGLADLALAPNRLSSLRDALADPDAPTIIARDEDRFLRSAAAALATVLAADVDFESGDASEASFAALERALKPARARAQGLFTPATEAERDARSRAADPAAYFAAIAAFHVAGETWTAHKAADRRLLDHQVTEGPDRGSWPPRGSGIASDRVPATALSILEFEVPYRYGRVFGVNVQGK